MTWAESRLPHLSSQLGPWDQTGPDSWPCVSQFSQRHHVGEGCGPALASFLVLDPIQSFTLGLGALPTTPLPLAHCLLLKDSIHPVSVPLGHWVLGKNFLE